MTYFQEDLKPIYELDKEIRGTVLTYSIYIETLIGFIISSHFCKDEEKANLLFSMLLSKPNVNFRTKERIFNKLLELYYPELLKKYPNLSKDIEKIRKLRNKLAHALLDTSDDALDKFHKEKKNDRIKLIWREDEKVKHQIITRNEAFDSYFKCLDNIQILVKIHDEIKKSNRTMQ